MPRCDEIANLQDPSSRLITQPEDIYLQLSRIYYYHIHDAGQGARLSSSGPKIRRTRIATSCD